MSSLPAGLARQEKKNYTGSGRSYCGAAVLGWALYFRPIWDVVLQVMLVGFKLFYVGVGGIQTAIFVFCFLRFMCEYMFVYVDLSQVDVWLGGRK